MAKTSNPKTDSSANLGFESRACGTWLTADKLRNNMDAAEYKHVVLGLIFFEYISNTFEEHRAKLLAGQGDYAGANAEDPDEYQAENVCGSGGMSDPIPESLFEKSTNLGE